MVRGAASGEFPDRLRCFEREGARRGPQPRNPAEPLGRGDDLALRHHASPTTSHALRCRRPWSGHQGSAVEVAGRVIGRCCAGGPPGGHTHRDACRPPLAPLSRRQRAASVVRGGAYRAPCTGTACAGVGRCCAADGSGGHTHLGARRSPRRLRGAGSRPQDWPMGDGRLRYDPGVRPRQLRVRGGTRAGACVRRSSRAVAARAVLAAHPDP